MRDEFHGISIIRLGKQVEYYPNEASMVHVP